jgi:PAT family beta-lactamase induction signal transducer AmpG
VATTAETRRKGARDLAWTSTAYFGEGLPYSFLHQLVTEYLTAIGAPTHVVGYTSWFHAAVVAKPLVGPAIDRSASRRGWMLVLQGALGAGMIGVAALVERGGGALTTPAVFWAGLAALALLHATHDAACDGFFLVALDRAGQALYSGTRIAAFRLAMYVGSGALVILAARTSWPVAFAVAGALMITMAAVNAALVPRVVEPRGETRPIDWRAYVPLFRQEKFGLVLAFVLTYRVCDMMTFAMSSPLLRDLHVDTEGRGILRSIALTASIVGSIFAGFLLARGGLRRWLVPFTWAMSIPFYLVIALVRPPFWGIAVLYALEQLTGALANTAAPVFLMSRCRRDLSAAHYGFFSAVVAFTSTIAGSASGHIVEATSFVTFFAICGAAALPALALSYVVPKDGIAENDEGRAG